MRDRVLVALIVIALSACDMVDVYQRQIDRATRAIAAATSDAARADAYADRGRGYSDKARLSSLRRLIGREEYLRMFTLAVQDHDRAVALEPGEPRLHFLRGLTYYDRAALVQGIDDDRTPWLDAARADFERASREDPNNAAAFDYLGLVEEQTGRDEEAVAAYSRVMALDPRLGRSRLADLYCNRGQAHLKDKDLDRAADALERSVALAAGGDGCSCEPFNALAYVYIDATGQYDKGWELVRRARRAGHVIAPEYVERLKRVSGRRG